VADLLSEYVHSHAAEALRGPIPINPAPCFLDTSRS
jgi:hypothetical protein